MSAEAVFSESVEAVGRRDVRAQLQRAAAA
jgi:hypothetical protein